MLDLNNDEIKAEGKSGNFDPSKIFGYAVVEDNTIVKTLENVVISGFDIGATDGGAAFFDIKLKDSNGNETNMREYEPDTTRDDYAKKSKSQMTRLKHVVTKFVPEGTALPAVATFPELWAAVKQLLIANQCNTKPVRVKLIYNDKGFLSIPKYVPFLESMTVAAADSKLNLNPGFDNLTRPSADKPAAAMSPAGAGSAADEDDLPF
tara:strand:+ start:113 stop:733 length:621 start_codon:yes stop_codon:yes gene_type:complete